VQFFLCRFPYCLKLFQICLIYQEVFNDKKPFNAINMLHWRSCFTTTVCFSGYQPWVVGNPQNQHKDNQIGNPTALQYGSWPMQVPTLVGLLKIPCDVSVGEIKSLNLSKRKRIKLIIITMNEFLMSECQILLCFFSAQQSIQQSLPCTSRGSSSARRCRTSRRPQSVGTSGINLSQGSQPQSVLRATWDRKQGVNFINILRAAFMNADSESAKNTDKLPVFFVLLGSVCKKVSCRILINPRSRRPN
jgi:hypothetical protein